MSTTQQVRAKLIQFALAIKAEAAQMRAEHDTYRGHQLSTEVVATAILMRQLATKLAALK